MCHLGFLFFFGGESVVVMVADTTLLRNVRQSSRLPWLLPISVSIAEHTFINFQNRGENPAEDISIFSRMYAGLLVGLIICLHGTSWPTIQT